MGVQLQPVAATLWLFWCAQLILFLVYSALHGEFFTSGWYVKYIDWRFKSDEYRDTAWTIFCLSWFTPFCAIVLTAIEHLKPI